PGPHPLSATVALMGAAMRCVRAAGRRLAGSALARVNRCRVTATDDVPILAAQPHCHTRASGRSRSVIKSEIAPAHKPAVLLGGSPIAAVCEGRPVTDDLRAEVEPADRLAATRVRARRRARCLPGRS